MPKLSFVALDKQFQNEKSDLMPIIENVLSSGMLIGGQEVESLEQELADYCGVKNVVAVSSGTEALSLSMEVFGIGKGDEVITPPNSFVSSTSTIVRLGATPVFADVLQNELINPGFVETAINYRTKAIMAVHLRGGVCEMNRLKRIAVKHGLILIEDAAQAIGSTLNGIKTGALGDIGCFSAHPLKLLNGVGDCGFITTNDSDIAKKLRRLRNVGLMDRDTVTEWGTVGRLDSLQAAILRYRLKLLPEVIMDRRINAKFYLDNLKKDFLYLPHERVGEFHSYNTFTIQIDDRDNLQKYLIERGIDCKVHYPIPIHLQPVAKDLGYAKGDFPMTEKLSETILSIPVHQFLTQDDLSYCVDTFNQFG